MILDDSIERKHKGGRNELIACVWLLNQGYEVFRNVCDRGEIDLIATKDGEIYFFDVKGAQRSKNGNFSLARLSDAQVQRNVKPLYIDSDGNCFIDWAPISLGGSRDGFVCEGCGATFSAVRTFQRYCSRPCRLAHVEYRKGSQCSAQP